MFLRSGSYMLVFIIVPFLHLLESKNILAPCYYIPCSDWTTLYIQRNISIHQIKQILQQLLN